MDPNVGRFIEEENAEKWMETLEIGEIVKIKGEELEVAEIGDRTVTFKLRSAMERTYSEFAARTSMEEMRAAMRREPSEFEKK